MSSFTRPEGRPALNELYNPKPLVLPRTWIRPAPTGPSEDFVIGSDPVSSRPPEAAGTPSAEQLFWFRWITGHQLSFIAWQLLAAAIDDITHTHGRRRAAAGMRATAFIDCYSAMLIYSSSCPRGLYHAFIRPRLVRQHPAFSGTWARDYRGVARFLRGHDDLNGHPGVPDLLTSRNVNLQVHDAVADKLVTNRRSLLREAVADPAFTRPSNAMEFLLYDHLFLTERRDITYERLLAQFAARVAACRADLAVNGLDTVFGDGEELPAAYRSRRLVRLTQEVPQVLVAALDAAADGAVPRGGREQQSGAPTPGQRLENASAADYRGAR